MSFELNIGSVEHYYEDLTYTIRIDQVVKRFFGFQMYDLRKSFPKYLTRYHFVIKHNEQTYLLEWRLSWGICLLEPGSTRITAAIILAGVAGLYDGVAKYPDFRDGFQLLIEDLRVAIEKHYKEEGTYDQRDLPPVDISFNALPPREAEEELLRALGLGTIKND